MAINGVFGNLGIAGAALVTGFLSQYLGWRAAFWIPGLIFLTTGMAYGAASIRARRSNAEQAVKVEPAISLSRPQQIRIVLLIAAAALFGGLIFNGVTVSLPKVFDERLSSAGLSLSLVGSASALIFAVAAFGQLPVGEALDRYGARAVLIGLLLVQIVALLALANAHGAWAFGLALVLVIAVFAEIPVTSWLMARFVASRLRARAYSLEYVFSLGVSSLIIPLIAHLHEGRGGFTSVFFVLAGAAAVVLGFALLLPAGAGHRQELPAA